MENFKKSRCDSWSSFITVKHVQTLLDIIPNTLQLKLSLSNPHSFS